jgi:hypothetical protein
MTKVTLYVFPGVPEEAGIAGDLGIEDVSCPYCKSSGSCAHLLACIDPLNCDVGGRFQGLEQEFIYRINRAFLPYLKDDGQAPEWKSEEISELWDWAESNWSQGDDEIEIDEIVLFRLISEILQHAAKHADFGSQLEGMGIETEYTLIYDDNPDKVLHRALQALEKLLAAGKQVRNNIPPHL